jgi:hypothetical protein
MWFTTYLPRKPVAPKTVLVIPLRSFRARGGGQASIVKEEKNRPLSRVRRERGRADRDSRVTRLGLAGE